MTPLMIYLGLTCSNFFDTSAEQRVMLRLPLWSPVKGGRSYAAPLARRISAPVAGYAPATLSGTRATFTVILGSDADVFLPRKDADLNRRLSETELVKANASLRSHVLPPKSCNLHLPTIVLFLLLAPTVTLRILHMRLQPGSPCPMA